MAVDRYYNEKDELAVLISPGFGAGWSTWSYDHPEIAYDRRIVEYFMTHPRPTEEEMSDFIYELGYGHPYTGGYGALEIVWVPRGQLFCICEYDGFETIQTPESLKMMEA